MPVKILGKEYVDHKAAVKALKKAKPEIKNPDAYIATIERKQEKKSKPRSRSI